MVLQTDLEREVERPLDPAVAAGLVHTIPTGWMNTGLSPMQVHIVDGRAAHRFDPSTARAAVLADSLYLGSTLGPSDISGLPGYLYRTHELQVLLTKGELYRLIRRSLDSREYKKLRRRFGVFFEIGEDFYDQSTGEALEPI